MKIHLTESELKKYIVNEIKDILKFRNGFKRYLYDPRTIEYVTEGLTMTFEPNRVIRVISRKFDLEKLGAIIFWNDRTTPNHPVKSLTVNKFVNSTRDYNKLVEICINFRPGFGLTKTSPEELNNIIHTFDACGWMFASILNVASLEEFKNVDKCDYTNKYTPYIMYFRPKFDQKVNINGVPDTCYHICPSRLVPKILKQGLKPKDYGRTSNHTERVFLFYKYPEDWKEQIADNFRKSRADEKYTLLKVDTGYWIANGQKTNNIPKFKFDSLTVSDNYPAIYTFEPIPPQYISILEEE